MYFIYVFHKLCISFLVVFFGQIFLSQPIQSSRRFGKLRFRPLILATVLYLSR